MKFDKFTIEPRKMTMTSEGFLTGDAYVTRAGVFNYGNRKELRAPEEVFHIDSLESMKLVPITLEHPAGAVTPDNIRALAVGYLGDNIRVDDDRVVASYRITDPEAIRQIQLKKRIELSMGYNDQDVMEPGAYKGDQYDLKQTQIRYNHCAIVTKGRAGSSVRFIMDADDNNNQEVVMAGRVKLDSISYEVPEEVEAAFSKMDSALIDANKELKLLETAKKDAATETSKVDALTAERDALKADLVAAKELNSDKVVAEKVDALVALRTSVLSLAPELKCDGLTHRELRVAAIKVVKADFDDAGKSDDYIQATFDYHLAAKIDSAVLNQGKQIIVQPNVKTDTQLTGRELMIARQKGQVK